MLGILMRLGFSQHALSRHAVAELQKRIEQLANESAKSLFMVDAFAAIKGSADGPPALPTDENYFTRGH
jgi:hypothetical protein